MPFPIRVDCQSGHGGESVPITLHFGAAKVGVKSLVDNWSGQNHHYFKCVGANDATYIVRHDFPSDIWELVFYDSGRGPGK